MPEAHDPSLGRMRSSRLELGIDLLGAWLVDVVYGRIGTRGGTFRSVFLIVSLFVGELQRRMSTYPESTVNHRLSTQRERAPAMDMVFNFRCWPSLGCSGDKHDQAHLRVQR